MRSDEELMESYADGDASALRELFGRHAPTLLRVMRHQLLRPADAEDLVQQTFLQLHRSRQDYRRGEPLKPWLYTIAMNLKREYFRRAKRRPETSLESALHHVTPAPDSRLRTETSLEVEYALSRLPLAQREVIVLHWLAGLPLPEVATLVGASLSAVKVRAHRGYAAMRAALAGDPGSARGEEGNPSKG